MSVKRQHKGKGGRGEGGKGEGGRGKGGGRHKKREGVGFKGITKRKSRSSNPERATSMYTCSCQGVFIETWLSLTHD